LDSKLSIIISELDNILLIEIIDNGVGITKSFMNRNRERESYGLINLKRRIDHLKKTQKREIVFNINGIIDAEGNVNGTRASISIKL
jgi:sensor histidine kinase YesM